MGGESVFRLAMSRSFVAYSAFVNRNGYVGERYRCVKRAKEQNGKVVNG